MTYFFIISVAIFTAGIIYLPTVIGESELVLNPDGETTVTIPYSDIVIGNIDFEDKFIEFRISNLDFDSRKNFNVFIRIPDAYSTSLDTNLREPDFYETGIANGGIIQVPLQLDVEPNPWPYESYSINMLLVFEGDVTVNYRALQHDHFFEQELFRTSVWEAIVEPSLVLEQDLPSWMPPEDNRTVVNHRIILSHTDDYKNKNLIYFLLPIIPAVSGALQLIFFQRTKFAERNGWFGSTIVISIAIVFGIKQYLPSDFTLIELILFLTLFFYVVTFASIYVYIFITQKKKPEKNGYLVDKTKDSLKDQYAHLEIERFFERNAIFVRIRNYGNMPLKDCLVLCNDSPCTWWDDSGSNPRNISPGGGANARIDVPYTQNPKITIKSGMNVIHESPLNDISLSKP